MLGDLELRETKSSEGHWPRRGSSQSNEQRASNDGSGKSQ